MDPRRPALLSLDVADLGRAVAFWHDAAWWGGVVLATQGLAGIAVMVE